jgi:hypothetical protein
LSAADAVNTVEEDAESVSEPGARGDDRENEPPVIRLPLSVTDAVTLMLL